MRRVEMLEIRSFASKAGPTDLDLPSLLEDFASEEGLESIAVYRNGEISSDW